MDDDGDAPAAESPIPQAARGQPVKDRHVLGGPGDPPVPFGREA
jgi:hypothetical protein